MNNEADRQRARGGLQKAMRGLDMLETNLQSCSDPQLVETLRRIQRRKARQSAPFLHWLQKGGESPPLSLPALDAEQGGDAAELDRGHPNKADCGVVLDYLELTAELIMLKLQRPAGFSFQPGQSAKLGVAGVKRRYSIASAPHEDFLEFFIELVPGGEMSERLRTISRGDRLTVDSVKGSFLLNENFSTHLMVATVTGVTPFVSILRHTFTGPLSVPGRHRFILLHGASYQDEFGYRKELEDLAIAYPDNFTYVPTVSRPGEPRNFGWPGQRGRVGEIVQPTIESLHLAPAFTCVYACGHSGMIDDVASRFGSLGFAVKREAYD